MGERHSPVSWQSGEDSMRIYRKIDALANKFDAVYPKELSARLRWWGKALGIDLVRLLRMIGMSSRQAAQKKSEDLNEILKSQEWEENARLVEGRLHRLLALFHYDWHALANRIHEPLVKAAGEEPSHATRRKGEVKRLRYTPNGDASDLLINRMAEGGPQSLSALLAYLVTAQAGADQVKS
jgi:hypothetical protein